MAKNNEYNIGDNKMNAQPPRGPMGGGPGGKMMAGAKPKNFKESIGKLFKYCGKYKPFIIIAFVLAILGAVLTLLGPNMIADISQLIREGAMLGGIDLSGVAKIGITLAIIYILSLVFTYSQSFIMATITQKISKRMRRDISQKINKLPLKYFDNTTFGDVLSRVTNDVDTIGQTLNQSIGQLLSGVVLLFGSLIMMFITNWIMALTAVLSSLLGFVFMMLIISKSQKYFRTLQNRLGAINGHIEEVYAGHNVVKAYNAEEKSKEKFSYLNNQLREMGWKTQFYSGLMQPIMGFIGNFGYVAVCVVGGALAFNGTIVFDVIIAFMIYIRLFTQPLTQLAQAFNQLQSTAASSERVFEFLEEKEMPKENDTTTLTEIDGNIEFKNVHFGYNEDRTIINNFSHKVKGGQKIAIVGPTGAGKTTMVNLLMRFYEINSGEITIDDVPISSLTRENIHDLFGMVLQDTWLFEGTIKDNIIYSKRGVSDEEIVKVCKAVGLHHFVKSLPQGYETVLDDHANLSQGQKQLVTIARAMIENAPMLILDEATSSVDTRTEIVIQNAMDKLMEGRTSFIIAHRLSTIKNADTILVMKDGDIIECGSHDELIANGGFYCNLYNSQFTN